MQAQNPRDSGRRRAAGTAAGRGGDLKQAARAIYAASNPVRHTGRDDSAGDNETCSRPPTDLRGNPGICAQRYPGVMTASPEAACIMPDRPGAWQMGRSTILKFQHRAAAPSWAGKNDANPFGAAALSVFFETALLRISQAKNVKPKHTIIREGRRMP